MRCAECGADISVLREFCPGCGAPTDPGLREARARRSGERSPQELKRNRKTVLIACAGIAALLAVSGKLHVPMRHGVHVDFNDTPKGPVVTTAVDLAHAFAQDSAAAEKRFGGREIAVSGEFLRIVPDGYGSIDMRLKTSNPDFPLGVDVADASVDDAKHLQPGQQLTVSCRRVAGTGNDPWLQDCAIEARDGPAAPSPPTPPAPPTKK